MGRIGIRPSGQPRVSIRWSSSGHDKTRTDKLFTGRLDFNQHARRQINQHDRGQISLQGTAWSPKPPKMGAMRSPRWGFWTPRGTSWLDRFPSSREWQPSRQPRAIP